MEGLSLRDLGKQLGEPWKAKAKLVIDVIDGDVESTTNEVLYRLVVGGYNINRKQNKIVVKGDKVKAVIKSNSRVIGINVSGRLEDVLQFIATLNRGELKDVFNIGVSIVNVTDFIAKVDNKYVRSLVKTM